MPRATVLVVEDEEDILGLVRYNLEKEGYDVVGVDSGEAGIKRAQEKAPDVVVLDLMLPGMDGMEACRILKNDKRTAHIPVIMLTAKSEESDIIAGLEIGADDYVTKPFSPKVLISRIRTALRRKDAPAAQDDTVIKIHDLVMHPGRHEAKWKGKRMDLTLTEFRILHYLARNPGWVYSRDQIVEAVQGSEYAVTPRAVDVQVVGLRKKLGKAGDLIETVRGLGYRLREEL